MFSEGDIFWFLSQGLFSGLGFRVDGLRIQGLGIQGLGG